MAAFFGAALEALLNRLFMRRSALPADNRPWR
jgi:hypothetical protein